MSDVAPSDAGGMEILSKTDAIVTHLQSAGESSVADIATAVNEPVSSTYRLVRNLVALGWVDGGSRRGVYRLGTYFLGIGGRVEDAMDIKSAALPSLRMLRRETGATSFLCIRRGTSAVCVERLEGRDVRSLAMGLGDALPLAAGAAPLALLAFLPGGEREAVIEQTAAASDGRWSRADIRQRVEATRARGYAVSDGDVTPGIAAVGAPMFNHRGELEGAVSVSGLHDRVLGDVQRTAGLVLEAAAAASAALGWFGGANS